MKVIKADPARRLEIPGVPGPAKRPVDIDATQTGFDTLRTLRIYEFDAGSVIDGHAEEDEVFVVVLSGSIQLAIGWDNAEDAGSASTLEAAGASGSDACAAYLPPHSRYQLTAVTSAEVAYARATPFQSRPPALFHAKPCAAGAQVDLLLEEATHASRLRLRLVQVSAGEENVAISLVDEEDTMAEVLAHVRGSFEPGALRVLEVDGEPFLLEASDTIVIRPGARPVLEAAPGATALLMTVLAV